MTYKRLSADEIEMMEYRDSQGFIKWLFHMTLCNMLVLIGLFFKKKDYRRYIKTIGLTDNETYDFKKCAHCGWFVITRKVK